MNIWFTRAGAELDRDWVKRFDPLHWTVEFPGGAAACVVTGDHALTVDASFLRRGDLVGLIYDSVDRYAHPAHARATNRDYRGCVLKFRWQATGAMPLDVASGATLTIEGRDAAGAARAWYVRLWNFAVGTASDAIITVDFDALTSGYSSAGEAVFAGDIDRMFISIVPPDYIEGSGAMRAAPVTAHVTISALSCDGRSSVLAINDAVVPELPLGMSTAYDDSYNLPPERLVGATERLGYRGTINHYIGMSHFPTLGGDGLVNAAVGMNPAALAWHRELARAAKAHGYELIFSLSFELFASLCPATWMQRASDGSAALTGYAPPSALLSPASSAAMAYLQRIAAQLVEISVAAGLVPRVQLGEPWWWVTGDHRICLYDNAAKAALGGSPVVIADIRGSKSAAERALLDAAGVLLAGATAGVLGAARAASSATVTHLLIYLPGPLDPASPEVRRANMPVGWATPAVDVLQLEDYEWVTGGQVALRQAAYATTGARLGYAPAQQHYLSGFAAAGQHGDWRAIVSAADEARARGVARVMVWALPQVLRDGITLFGGEDDVDAFDEVDFPIAIGADASVAPGFSTNVVTSASGHEYRNANWASARLRFDAGPGVRGDAELQTLIGFFRARRGSAVGFRFRDPYDFSSNGMTGSPVNGDQVIGIGDGVKTRFALVKHYGAEERRVTRPVAGSVLIAVGGVARTTGWTLTALGVVQFDVAPAAGAAVTAGYLFDVPVRFGDDRLEINRASFLAGAAPSVPLIEVREA